MLIGIGSAIFAQLTRVFKTHRHTEWPLTTLRATSVAIGRIFALRLGDMAYHSLTKCESYVRFTLSVSSSAIWHCSTLLLDFFLQNSMNRHNYNNFVRMQHHKKFCQSILSVLLSFNSFVSHPCPPRMGPGYPLSAFAPSLSIHLLIFCSLLPFPFFLLSSTLLIFFYCPSDPFLPE